MKNDDHESWNRLAGAARRAGAGRPPDPEPSAPASFVSRMRDARKGIWRFARTVLWRRWSLVAVLVAVLLYLLASLLLKPDPAPSIRPPEPPDPLSR